MGRADLNIISSAGLAVANRIYRAMVMVLPWSEFMRQNVVVTPTAGTTAGTGAYDWLKEPVFLNITAITIQDQDDANIYKIISPAPDEVQWAALENAAPASVPTYYTRYVANDGTVKIEVRPAPKYASKIIQARGVIEPRELTSGDVKTGFLQAAADDAFAYMVAADFLDTDGFGDYADKQLAKAGMILQQLFGKDSVPIELPSLIVKGG